MDAAYLYTDGKGYSLHAVIIIISAKDIVLVTLVENPKNYRKEQQQQEGTDRHYVRNH